MFKELLDEYDRYARATRAGIGVGAAAHIGGFALAVGVGEWHTCRPPAVHRRHFAAPIHAFDIHRARGGLRGWQ